jgi:hypothetical protein
MTFTQEQKEVMQELANFISLKGLVIENSNDMNKAFSMYLQSNASHYYFTCDEFEKENFINQLKK